MIQSPWPFALERFGQNWTAVFIDCGIISEIDAFAMGVEFLRRTRPLARLA